MRRQLPLRILSNFEVKVTKFKAYFFDIFSKPRGMKNLTRMPIKGQFGVTSPCDLTIPEEETLVKNLVLAMWWVWKKTYGPKTFEIPLGIAWTKPTKTNYGNIHLFFLSGLIDLAENDVFKSFYFKPVSRKNNRHDLIQFKLLMLFKAELDSTHFWFLITRIYLKYHLHN